MQFSLPTEQQRRIKKTQRAHSRREKYTVWHRKFAWLPIRINPTEERFVWLEFILRKGTYRLKNNDKAEWEWKYKDSVLDLLADGK